MIRIVADNKIPFMKGVLEPFADVVYLPGAQISREAALNADALIIRTRTKCDAALLEGTPVKFIATATIGYDHIDTDWCGYNSVFWTSAPGCNSSSVQQYVAAALLELAAKSDGELAGRKIGIVGVGNVGSKIRRAAEILGMKVLLNDPPRARKEGSGEFTDLESLLRESDIVTLHVPLSREGEDATWHLFGDRCFSLVKEGAWFINTSRGEVVDTASLKKALSEGRISEAVIDVWENEPYPDPELLASAFIATPHIAGYSTDGKANGTSMAVNSLCKFFGLPLKNWYPQEIPGPLSPELILEGQGRSGEEIIREAVLHTYDIWSDDRNLRSNPGSFEKLRGDYPLRREFPAYTLNMVRCRDEVTTALREIGFRVPL